jgi:uncharacterized protein YutE (UPF0331/DUF86 family)
VSPETLLLLSSLQACRQRIAKLSFSLAKNQVLFPMALDTVTKLTEDQEESIDALILRYSQCVTMIQEQLFKGIAFLEQEDLSDKSNRDKTLLMEKLGAIQSAQEFGTAAMLRNKFAHHYPELNQARIDRLNLLPEESHFVIDTFKEIETYLETKKLIDSPT